MAEAATTLFVMHGAREVLAFGAIHLEQQIVVLEGAAASNSGLAFDLAKTLIESACKTVLSERACAYDGGWDLPRLLKETLSTWTEVFSLPLDWGGQGWVYSRGVAHP